MTGSFPALVWNFLSKCKLPLHSLFHIQKQVRQLQADIAA